MKKQIKISNDVSFHVPTQKQFASIIAGKINKDSNLFTGSKSIVPVVHLKGIGRFCKCGCGKRLEGKYITKRSKKGNKFTYWQPLLPTTKYASAACSHKGKSHNGYGRLICKLNLSIIPDRIPYRELVVYYNNSQKMTINITPEHKDIWQQLEKIARYVIPEIQVQYNKKSKS